MNFVISHQILSSSNFTLDSEFSLISKFVFDFRHTLE